MTNPYKDTPTARYTSDRLRDLSHRKTQAEIAAEAGFVNANFMSLLKSGKNKVLLDRVPSLARALEVDPAYLMRMAWGQVVWYRAMSCNRRTPSFRKIRAVNVQIFERDGALDGGKSAGS